MQRKQRLIDLHTSWAFKCSCSTCSMHPKLVEASDARLADISSLTEQLEEEQEEPGASTQIAQALISLHLQERLHGPLTNAYRFAALAFCAKGQRWTAIRYARLATEIGMLSDGFQDDNVQLMMRVADNPEAEACWPK